MSAAVPVLQPNVEWVNYSGGIQMKVGWTSPGPGSYILEKTTDFTTWVEAGSWKPGSAGAVYALNADDYNVLTTAYRMRVAAAK